MNYNAFDEVIFRAPIYPLAGSRQVLDFDSVIEEAIFLASPELSSLIKARNESSDKGEHFSKAYQSLAFSHYKYLNRMSSRCTPFGMFAGCGSGKIGDASIITLDTKVSFRTNTRLDMNFLCELIELIAKDENIRWKLKYFPNSSLHSLFDSYRYVEYCYKKNKRSYLLSEIESDDVLETILSKSQTGAYLAELSELLKNDYSEEEILSYLDSLIDNQILRSDLYPTLTGEDLLDGVINKLSEYQCSTSWIDLLQNIRNKLKSIDDCPFGERLHYYDQIKAMISSAGVNFVEKYLFQSDLAIKPLTATIKRDLVDDVKRVVEVMHQLTFQEEKTSIKRFCEALYDRYEEEEVPLVEVIDTDIGIGFGDYPQGAGDIHPLVDNLIPLVQSDTSTLTFNVIDHFLYEKYHSAKVMGETVVYISDEELSKLPESKGELPATFAIMVEVLSTCDNSSEPAFLFKGMGGTSAANLLGRFGHIDSNIKDLLNSIASKEQEIYGPEKVIAEIVHLPESRLGNVLYRTSFRQYEIPYLANSSVDMEYQIPITDILISVKDRKNIVLRSKKLNKVIIPRLSTAHNYNKSSLPIYSFLCNLQSHGRRSGLSFSWGKLVGNRSFLPRIMYKNCVLSPASWNLSVDDIKDVSSIYANDFDLKVLELRNKYNIPEVVYLKKGDDGLLIDFKDKLSMQVLFKEAKNRPLMLEEFIFNEGEPLISSDKGRYTNEVIISFFERDKK